MSGREKGDAITLALMTLTAAFWGAAFIGGKIALREFPPMTLTFICFLIATVIIFIYLWKTEEVRTPRREDIPVRARTGVYFVFKS